MIILLKIGTYDLIPGHLLEKRKSKRNTISVNSVIQRKRNLVYSHNSSYDVTNGHCDPKLPFHGLDTQSFTWTEGLWPIRPKTSVARPINRACVRCE